MKIIDLSGKEHKIALYQYLLGKSSREFSGPAQHCITLLKEVFPLHEICAEVPLPGRNTLFLDFFLPKIKLAVEVHGRQHSHYTKHFHGSYEGFLGSLNRDGEKAELLEKNGITLITLYDGSRSEWKSLLENWMLS